MSRYSDASHLDERPKRLDLLDDLQDRYNRLLEDHRLLKEERNAQQEKIKQMSTKFMRIMGDLKRSGGPGPEGGVVLQSKGGRDKDAETYIELLQQQLKTLKKANRILVEEKEMLEKRLERAKKATMVHPSQYRSSSVPPNAPTATSGGTQRFGPAPVRPRIGPPSALQPPVSPATYIDKHRRTALQPARQGGVTSDACTQTAVWQSPLVTSATQTPAFELLLQQYTPKLGARVPARTMTEASSQCGERQLLGDSFLGGDPLQQKEYVDRLHALVDSLRQKLEESQDMLQRMRQDSLAVAKERDDVVRRCDQLLARRLQEEQGKVADIGVLQREVKEKNAKLVLLHSRFQQAEGQLLSLQEANAGVLAEMRQLNQQLGEERRKNLELERQLQLAQFSEDRQRDYATLLEDLRVEKRAVEEENARLVQQLLHQQGSIEGDLRREYEDQLKGMEASIFKWETVSKRQFQDLTLLQGKFDTVQEEYKAVREAKARLEQQLARLQGEHQALAEKLQLCAALQGEARPADLETALAVVRAARLKGQPTDLEFLLPAFDQQTGGKLELEHMRAENATLLRDLATSHKFVGVLKQRLEEVERREKERIQQLQETMEQLQAQGRQAKESDGRIIQSQLEKILHLEANVLGVKQQLGTRLSIDGGLGPLNRLAPDENLIEVYLGHLRLEAAYFEADPAACPPPIFVALDFLDHVTQTTAVVADLSPVFDNTYMYSVQMNEFLLFYLQSKTLDLDLNRSHGADYSTLATASIPLFDLLEPPFALRGFALLLSPQRERVGLLEYGVVVKRPLPQHWLVECREAQRRGVGKVALKLEEKEADAMYHRLDGAVSLSIHVIACADLTPLAGLSSDGGPACVPYVNYTFFTHPDMHVEMATPGVRTVAPDFHHVHTYPCVFSVPFLSYLAFGSLPVVVFNELDDNVENYVGSVLVPLKGLLDGPDAKVTGTFDLADPAGKPAGRLTLSLWWNPREVRSLDEELSLAELGEFD